MLLLSILLTDIFQIVFETCYIFSLELTYRPTSLDRRFDSDIDGVNDDNMQNN